MVNFSDLIFVFFGNFRKNLKMQFHMQCAVPIEIHHNNCIGRNFNFNQ